MNEKIEAGPVDRSLNRALSLSIEAIIQERCTSVEAVRFRLMLGHPSDQLEAMLEDIHQIQLRTLYDSTEVLLNYLLDETQG